MILGVIPARYHSSRLPGKILMELDGKPIIQWVWQRVKSCSLVDRVVVATDYKPIALKVEEFGGEAVMTPADLASGTDRCAAVAELFPEYEWILNVQGDEPFIRSSQIANLIDFGLRGSKPISTLVHPIKQAEDIHSPNVVKCVFNPQRQALYFSRASVPFLRDITPEHWPEHHQHWRHLGIYLFQRQPLLEVCLLEQSPLERIEKLEQLRWLEAGYPIYVQETDWHSLGIDTYDDYLRAAEMIKTAHEKFHHAH